jgi:hypothetical protein
MYIQKLPSKGPGDERAGCQVNLKSRCCELASEKLGG